MAPRIQDVMQSVLWTYHAWLAPSIDEPYAQSLSVTTELMLRHLQARIEHEGPTLWEDNADLRSVLTTIRAAVPAMVDEIDAVLAREFRATDAYPTVDSLVDEAEALRVVLSHAIGRLWADDDPEAHDLVRAYLSRQMMREGKWMAEVFVGEARR